MDDKLGKGTYPGNASDLNTEISKIASTTQLGRIKVGDNLTIDTAGRLSGNPAVDISGKMDKYQTRFNIRDYDDLTEDGFYILAGSANSSPPKNAPYSDQALVQVWNYGNNIYQNAVSYYKAELQFTRCFQKEVKNTKWEKIINTTDIVNNLTTTASEKVLDGRQGPAIVNKINGLAGGYSGTFPLTTAVKEGIYLLPATNKFYVCVENYSGSSLTAPNANFEELSVYTNRSKLDNLLKNEWIQLESLPGQKILYKKIGNMVYVTFMGITDNFSLPYKAKREVYFTASTYNSGAGRFSLATNGTIVKQNSISLTGVDTFWGEFFYETFD